MIVSGTGRRSLDACQVSPSKNEIVLDPNLNASEIEVCRRKTNTPSQPSSPAPQPSGLKRATQWSEDVEECYRFQIAGYRDIKEYCHVQGVSDNDVKRWPHNGYIKVLLSRKGGYIYFDKARECQDKDLHKCKLFNYNAESQ